MTSKLLIYGANGYTGQLTAELARSRGQSAILAGRSADKIGPLAESLEMPQRIFGLDDADAIAAGLEGVDVVLHCAGPFSRTARPMADACLATGTHYLDITGEVEVFEALTARDAEAREAGVMLMPGAGFDVVPSDCLAAHLKAALPDATHLVLAFTTNGSVSHGTATTIVENLHQGGLIRRDGKLTPVPPAYQTRKIDFGRGPTACVSVPWGDVSTAFHSTGIPNIVVYTAAPLGLRISMRAVGRLGWLFRAGPMQRFLKRRIDARPAGPSEADRNRTNAWFFGEVTNAAGETRRVRMKTPEGYTLTALASLAIADRVLAGNAPAGFQTPSSAYGAELITELDGVTRDELE